MAAFYPLPRSAQLRHCCIDVASPRLALHPRAGLSSGEGAEELPSHLRTNPVCICKEEETIRVEEDLTSCRPGPVQLNQVVNWNLTVKLSEVLIICHILECMSLFIFYMCIC